MACFADCEEAHRLLELAELSTFDKSKSAEVEHEISDYVVRERYLITSSMLDSMTRLRLLLTFATQFEFSYLADTCSLVSANALAHEPHAINDPIGLQLSFDQLYEDIQGKRAEVRPSDGYLRYGYLRSMRASANVGFHKYIGDVESQITLLKTDIDGCCVNGCLIHAEARTTLMLQRLREKKKLAKPFVFLATVQAAVDFMSNSVKTVPLHIGKLVLTEFPSDREQNAMKEAVASVSLMYKYACNNSVAFVIELLEMFARTWTSRKCCSACCTRTSHEIHEVWFESIQSLVRQLMTSAPNGHDADNYTSHRYMFDMAGVLSIGVLVSTHMKDPFFLSSGLRRLGRVDKDIIRRHIEYMPIKYKQRICASFRAECDKYNIDCSLLDTFDEPLQSSTQPLPVPISVTRCVELALANVKEALSKERRRREKKKRRALKWSVSKQSISISTVSEVSVAVRADDECGDVECGDEDDFVELPPVTVPKTCLPSSYANHSVHYIRCRYSCCSDLCIFAHDDSHLRLPPRCNRGRTCKAYKCTFLHLSDEGYRRALSFYKDPRLADAFTARLDECVTIRQSIADARRQIDTRKEEEAQTLEYALRVSVEIGENTPTEDDAVTMRMAMKASRDVINASVEEKVVEESIEQNAIDLAIKRSLDDDLDFSDQCKDWSPEDDAALETSSTLRSELVGGVQVEPVSECAQVRLAQQPLVDECTVCLEPLENKRFLPMCCRTARLCVSCAHVLKTCPFCSASPLEGISIVV